MVDEHWHQAGPSLLMLCTDCLQMFQLSIPPQLHVWIVQKSQWLRVKQLFFVSREGERQQSFEGTVSLHRLDAVCGCY